MAEIANITTAVDTLRKPPYMAARHIEHIDTLNFRANDRLPVRITRRNGRAVGYEQGVQWETADFAKCVGNPGTFQSETPIIANAQLAQLRHEINDVTMHFAGRRYSEWDTQDTIVLVVEAWQPMTAEQVTAYKAIRDYHKDTARRDRAARHLEQQARVLRNHR